MRKYDRYYYSGDDQKNMTILITVIVAVLLITAIIIFRKVVVNILGIVFVIALIATGAAMCYEHDCDDPKWVKCFALIAIVAFIVAHLLSRF